MSVPNQTRPLEPPKQALEQCETEREASPPPPPPLLPLPVCQPAHDPNEPASTFFTQAKAHRQTPFLSYLRRPLTSSSISPPKTTMIARTAAGLASRSIARAAVAPAVSVEREEKPAERNFYPPGGGERDSLGAGHPCIHWERWIRVHARRMNASKEGGQKEEKSSGKPRSKVESSYPRKNALEDQHIWSLQPAQPSSGRSPCSFEPAANPPTNL